jgi:hypothetical protein
MKRGDVAKYFQKLGRKGGRVVSTKKIEAARANLATAHAARRKYPPCPRYSNNHSHRFAKSGKCACGFQKGNRSMKAFSVTAFFPEVKAHLAYQSTTKEAAEMETAVSRALQEIRKRDGIKGKQLSEVRLTVKVLDRGA